MAAMPDIGPLELIIVAFVVLLLFGPGKAADLGSSLGKGIREFNNAKNSVEDEIRQGMRDAESKPLQK